MLRFLFIFCGLIALAGVALAGGEYQHTKDGKTTVWNDVPKPGDVSTWNGDRDSDGYATGFGTLTWYTQQKGESALYAVYYGNMVHGKFDGPVNLHVKGKTGHAFFTDGTRTSRWARGSAPNWKGPQKSPESVAKEAAAKAEKPASSSLPPTQNAPAEHADSRGSTPKASPSMASASESSSGLAVQHLKTEATPAAPPVAEKRDEIVQRDAIAKKLEPPAESPASSPEKVDGSARALVGPPSALRANSRPEASAASPEPSTAQHSDVASTSGPADLTEAQAIDLANAEAGARGYDVATYASPKADYSKVKGRWSIFYDKKSADPSNGDAKPLIVTVEDKSKNAFIASPK